MPCFGKGLCGYILQEGSQNGDAAHLQLELAGAQVSPLSGSIGSP